MVKNVTTHKRNKEKVAVIVSKPQGWQIGVVEQFLWLVRAVRPPQPGIWRWSNYFLWKYERFGYPQPKYCHVEGRSFKLKFLYPMQYQAVPYKLG